MSPQATSELAIVREIIQSTALNGSDDKRLSPFSLELGKLDTSGLYKLIKSQSSSRDAASNFIWRNAAPPRVKFFIWLLLQRRIQCRSNLHRRNIVESPVCEICYCEDETPEHIVLRCEFAVAFWTKLGMDLSPDQPIRDLVLNARPDAIPEIQFPMFLALCCWQL